MSLVTIVNNEMSTLATDKLVYGPDEFNSLCTVLEHAAALKDLLDSETIRISAAEKSGYDNGYESGSSEGREEALKHIAIKLVQLSKAADLERKELRDSAGVIAITIVQKIANSLGPVESITALAQSAAAELVSRESVALRVHPKHADAVSKKFHSLKDSSCQPIETISDSELSENDCILETEYGQIKADLATQLRILEDKLYAQ